jgi:RNA polymerase-binding transcription factor DksA
VETTQLTPRLRQELAEALKRERARLQRALGGLLEAERALGISQDEEGDAGNEPADVASDLAEQEIDTSLAQLERARLSEVEAALERLAEGTYGLCERCGAPIAAERLFALPWTRLCQRCARDRELTPHA